VSTKQPVNPSPGHKRRPGSESLEDPGSRLLDCSFLNLRRNQDMSIVLFASTSKSSSFTGIWSAYLHFLANLAFPFIFHIITFAYGWSSPFLIKGKGSDPETTLCWWGKKNRWRGREASSTAWWIFCIQEKMVSADWFAPKSNMPDFTKLSIKEMDFIDLCLLPCHLNLLSQPIRLTFRLSFHK